MKLKEFFYYRKSDRIAIIFLVLTCVAVMVGIHLFRDTRTATSLTHEDSIYLQKSPISSTFSDRKKGYSKSEKGGYYAVESSRAELFDFDPNTADSTQFLRLGLRPWQVRNIYKYRAKGGVYRKPTDFARLYGLTVEEYRRLEPHIKIKGDFRPASVLVEKEARQTYERDTLRYPVKLKAGEHVALDLADTAAFKRVPGIGSYYARAIVNYGKRLGGYVSVNQLREIDNFPDEALTYFEIKNPQVKRLNVNKLTLNELKRHPYINFFQARAITDYRRLRGPLKSLNDLRLLKDFDSDAIKKLEPYVTF